jgi:hypothetical protein
MGKFSIKDFGRVVKPKILLRAFILCKHQDFDPDSWWRKTKENNRVSRTFKKDMISGTYGMDFKKLFQNLQQNSFVCQITSFLIFHRGSYKLVSSPEETVSLNLKNKIVICAVGVKFFNSYNSNTKEPEYPWKFTEQDNILWLFQPKQLIPIELIEQYENAEVGDLIVYSKSNGLVSKVTKLKNKKSWWAVSNWTNKQVIVISGQSAKPHKLSVERPYKFIK